MFGLAMVVVAAIAGLKRLAQSDGLQRTAATLGACTILAAFGVSIPITAAVNLSLIR
jgi:hypothetical protein